MSETNNEPVSVGPRCIGIIPDGNRRWAKERGLKSWQGHEAGIKKSKEVLQWAAEAGVEYIIGWGFSTENWTRPQEELDVLFKLFSEQLKNEIPFFLENGVRILTIGDLSKFSKEIQDSFTLLKHRTAEQKKITFVVALNYGGRDELLRAVNAVCVGRKNLLAPVTAEEFAAALDTKEIPDPEMVIRTSGEQRTSGFLPWQTIYSELFFPSAYWPALTKEQFIGLIEEFHRRQRRFGT